MRSTVHKKESYYSVKSDLLKCQKRPITRSPTRMLPPPPPHPPFSLCCIFLFKLWCGCVCVYVNVCECVCVCVCVLQNLYNRATVQCRQPDTRTNKWTDISEIADIRTDMFTGESKNKEKAPGSEYSDVRLFFLVLSFVGGLCVCLCVCVCVWERERERVCVCERESACVYVCVFVV